MSKRTAHPRSRHATLVGWRVTDLRLPRDGHYPVLAITLVDPASGCPVLHWLPGEPTAARIQPL